MWFIINQVLQSMFINWQSIQTLDKLTKSNIIEKILCSGKTDKNFHEKLLRSMCECLWISLKRKIGFFFSFALFSIKKYNTAIEKWLPIGTMLIMININQRFRQLYFLCSFRLEVKASRKPFLAFFIPVSDHFSI